MHEGSDRRSSTAARKRGTVTLTAWVDVDEGHDVEKHLRSVESYFANTFSIFVHEMYPDAQVRTIVEVEPHA